MRAKIPLQQENDYDSDSDQIQQAREKVLRDLERAINNKIKCDETELEN